MATLKQKIEAECRMRELLEDNELPAPDSVEYGETCIRLFWHKTKHVVIIDIDEPPEGEEAAVEAPQDREPLMGGATPIEWPLANEPFMRDLLTGEALIDDDEAA